MSGYTKTTALRNTITAQLRTVQGAVYYQNAADDAIWPYKVFDLRTVNLGDSTRDDLTLTVDVWDFAKDPKRAEAIADNIEALFNVANLPQETILPTFFRESRNTIDDPEKQIKHIQLTFLIQNYEREVQV